VEGIGVGVCSYNNLRMWKRSEDPKVFQLIKVLLPRHALYLRA